MNVAGDEADGYDETICPVDYQQAGMISDDELHAILCRNLPAGCRLTAIFDCCHSGSALDLPFTYRYSHITYVTNNKSFVYEHKISLYCNLKTTYLLTFIPSCKESVYTVEFHLVKKDYVHVFTVE
jgi:hypothetical protein